VHNSWFHFDLQVNDAEPVLPELSTHPVFLHNLSLIYYYDRQPWKSLEIALALYKHFQVSSNSSARGALEKRNQLLIVALHINLQQFDSALAMIDTMKMKRVGMTSPSTSHRNSPTAGGGAGEGNIQQRAQSPTELPYEVRELLNSQESTHLILYGTWFACYIFERRSKTV